MRCLIIDDEAPARHEMRALLSQHADVEIVGEAADVETALALTARHRPDIVFLDIKLTGETGFDYVAQLSEPLPRIVFVTAFDNFAIRAFECNAMDYLLKPIRAERLAVTLRRFAPLSPRPPSEQDFVFFKGASTAKFVPWSEVRRIESQGNYTTIHLADGSSTLVLRTLKQWTDLAPESHFLQVRRTTLVRRADIRALRPAAGSHRELVLIDGTVVSIGRTYWPRIQEVLGNRLR